MGDVKKKTKGWSDEQLKYLTENFSNLDVSIKEIIEFIGKSESSIYSMAKKLGLKSIRALKIVDNKKKCTSCEEYKDLEQFQKTNKTKTGVTSKCKDCFSKENREKNRLYSEKIKEERERFKLDIQCTKCGEIKSYDSFNGFGKICKTCARKARKENLKKRLREKGY